MNDPLDNIVIDELTCFNWDGHLSSISKYLHMVEVEIRSLYKEKALYKNDLLALIEIKKELLILDELKKSTLRALDKSQRYHKEREK